MGATRGVSSLKKYMHPRPYLSYSQLVLWEKNPARYKAIYLGGRQFGTNRGQALGREIAEAIETDEETGDAVKDWVIAQLPKYELRDKEIRAILGTGKDAVPLLAKPDSCKINYLAIIEYKTGAEDSWSQAKVDRDDQLTFYATVTYLITRKIPDLDLYHAPTKLDGLGRPVLVGDIKRYPTKRTLLDIMKMQARMKRAWREIGEMVELETI